ncbi:MAG: hypothetical protein QGG40_14760, partial [Myxococcota bacterium]|nr:hypothetical protein [Myxococcota bacterium]
ADRLFVLAEQHRHLAALERSHFDGRTLSFEQGSRRVPNENYEQQLAQWRVEQARREKEEQEGPARKRHAHAPPGKDTEVWDTHGIRLSVRLDPGEQPGDVPVTAGVRMPVEGYEAIELQTDLYQYFAWLPGCHVTLLVEGDRVEPVRSAILDLLLASASPE